MFDRGTRGWFLRTLSPHGHGHRDCSGGHSIFFLFAKGPPCALQPPPPCHLRSRPDFCMHLWYALQPTKVKQKARFLGT